jgi:hypothetical protein
VRVSTTWKIPARQEALCALVSAALVFSGCGGSGPLGNEDPTAPTGTLRFVPVADVDTYISAVRGTIPALNLVRDEFTAIAEGVASEKVTPYWAGQFTGNLMLRSRQLQDRIRAIRPETSELQAIHQTYEDAVAAYIEAFGMFLDQVGISTSQSVEDVNTVLYRGNYLMNQYQLMLSSFRGEWVTL